MAPRTPAAFAPGEIAVASRGRRNRAACESIELAIFIERRAPELQGHKDCAAEIGGA